MSHSEGVEALVFLGWSIGAVVVAALVLYVKWAIWDRLP